MVTFCKHRFETKHENGDITAHSSCRECNLPHDLAINDLINNYLRLEELERRIDELEKRK